MHDKNLANMMEDKIRASEYLEAAFEKHSAGFI